MPGMSNLESELAETRALLEQGDGLWEYWWAHNITRTDPEWAEFLDAVRDHLAGKPVPRRFLPLASTREVRRQLLSDAEAVRENIGAYLQHVASVEVGSIASPASREVIRWCVAWVQNRLDERWLRDKVVAFPGAERGPEDAISFPPLEVRQRRFAKRVQRVERAPLVLDGEPSEAESTLAAVLEVVLQTEEVINRRTESPADTAHRQSVTYAQIRDIVRTKAGLSTEPVHLTERALSGMLSAEARGRKDAEDTVEAIRADLEEERKYRDRAEVLLDAVRSEVLTWETYAEEPEDDKKSIKRIRDLVAPRPAEPDHMHPTGRCSCGGEGRCDWCKANPDPYQEEPAPEAILEVMQDTTAYIESCLAARPTLEAVRKVVQQYNDPANEKFGSLVAMQKITQALAAPEVPDEVEELLDVRESLDGTKAALRQEMARCQAAEAKLKALGEVVESTTVGEWRDMIGYKRLHSLLAGGGA